jgi:L-alanine-DL-glutamate epimerase-like enolase superfamily enzyme
MEVTDLTVYTLSETEGESKADATQATAVIEVETDTGLTGVGEASTSPWVVEAIVNAPQSHTKSRGLREVVLGRDPFDVEVIWDDMFRSTYGLGRKGAAINAMSGVDMALWDLVGKATEKPIYKLLGGEYRDSIRAYASTLFPEDPSDVETMRRRAREAVADGFTAVKFGWGGFGESEETDDALVGAARAELGPDVDLMVDAGLCFRNDVKGAVKRINRLDEEYDLYWLEEPVYADNYDGYAELAARCQTRVVGGESEYTTYGFRDLIGRGDVDGVQPDVARSGGITHLDQIASMAKRRGVPFYPHGFSTEIVIAASLHLVAANENAPFLEYCVDGGDLRWELVEEDFPVEDGRVRVPERPGLGVTLNRDVLERYDRQLE